MRLSDCSSDVCSSYLKARAVVDLGITPGGWSQVVRKANPRARVAGIDLLPCEPIEGVDILEMDFMDDAAPDALIEALGSAPDLVISDMAAKDRKSTRLNSSHY